MAGVTGEYRLYTELAQWWPLISPPAEYAQEAAYLSGVLTSAALPVREVLDLGSGGGGVAAHLKERFAMTLADLSAGRPGPACGPRRASTRKLIPAPQPFPGGRTTFLPAAGGHDQRGRRHARLPPGMPFS